MSGPRRNVELKARDPDPAWSLASCRRIGAEDRGQLWQRDTYFTVPAGRLKLREQRPGDAQLIQYHRADRPQERESRYRIAPVPDADAMGAALAAALGVRIVVTKLRRLFLYGATRIHLDDVEGLGCFVEFEAVAPPQSDLSAEHRVVARLRGAFRIGDDRLVELGYADQLERIAGIAGQLSAPLTGTTPAAQLRACQAVSAACSRSASTPGA